MKGLSLITDSSYIKYVEYNLKVLYLCHDSTSWFVDIFYEKFVDIFVGYLRTKFEVLSRNSCSLTVISPINKEILARHHVFI
jgi:hypothetical protein